MKVRPFVLAVMLAIIPSAMWAQEAEVLQAAQKTNDYFMSKYSQES